MPLLVHRYFALFFETKNPLSVIELKITAVGIKICTVDWAPKDLIELNKAVEKTQGDCDFSTGICGFSMYGQYGTLGGNEEFRFKLLRSSYEVAFFSMPLPISLP